MVHFVHPYFTDLNRYLYYLHFIYLPLFRDTEPIPGSLADYHHTTRNTIALNKIPLKPNSNQPNIITTSSKACVIKIVLTVLFKANNNRIKPISVSKNIGATRERLPSLYLFSDSEE